MSVNRSILKKSRHIGFGLLQFNSSTERSVDELKLHRGKYFGDFISDNMLVLLQGSEKLENLMSHRIMIKPTKLQNYVHRLIIIFAC